VTDTEIFLAAYDDQMRGAPPTPPAGVTYEKDGPLLRIVGQFRGFVSGPRELGVDGDALDGLIASQRDFFAARGEAVEWKTRGHDTPADLTERLRAAGFLPEDRETVLIGRAADMAVREPVLPDGVTLRRVTADADMHRVAAMESTVWGEDRGWLADDLTGRIAAAPTRSRSTSPRRTARWSARPGWPSARARRSRACGAVPRSPSGGGGGSTAPWSPPAPPSRPRAASRICMWTPPTTAHPSCAASASSR
jgi:hypothetical protein